MTSGHPQALGRVVLPTEPHGPSPHIEAQVRAVACQNQFSKGRDGGGGGGGEGAARGRGRLQGHRQVTWAVKGRGAVPPGSETPGGGGGCLNQRSQTGPLLGQIWG